MGNRKGSRRERELRDIFDESGFTVLRVAGSGSSPEDDLPDLFVGDGRRMFAIEVKSAKRDSYIYLGGEEVVQLTEFARGFHRQAVPLIAVRFNYHNWYAREPVDAYRAYHTPTGNVRVGTDDLDEWTTVEDLIGGGYRQ